MLINKENSWNLLQKKGSVAILTLMNNTNMQISDEGWQQMWNSIANN